MIITIAGTPGSGKSTIAELLAKRLNLKHYSIGDFMRAQARKRGVSIQQLAEQARTDRSIDDANDQQLVELAKKEDDFVIDARLGWHFIPQSVKILLMVSEDEAARRIFAARRPDEKENTTLEKTREGIRKRFASEHERYKKLYNLDYADSSHYDLVIDTTKLTPEKVVETIVDFLKKKGKV
jgi:cytidylate kinase